MPTKDNNIIKYNQGEKSINLPFIVYADLECLRNLTEGIHSDKCINCKSDISYMKVIDETLIFRCFNCKRNYKKEINKELI